MKKGRFYRLNKKGEQNLPSFYHTKYILEYTGQKEMGVLSSDYYYRMKSKKGNNLWVKENEVNLVNNSIKKLG